MAKRNTKAAVALEPPPESAAIWVDVYALKAWTGNPRKNDPAVAAVADSIQRFGFAAPILARKSNGEVIAGHTRLKAAMQLGLKTVPVRYLDLTAKEAHLLSLADNKLGELATWDDAMLAELLRECSAEDLTATGFSEAETLALIGNCDPLKGEVEDQGKERIVLKVPFESAEQAKKLVTEALTEAGVQYEVSYSRSMA